MSTVLTVISVVIGVIILLVVLRWFFVRTKITSAEIGDGMDAATHYKDDGEGSMVGIGRNASLAENQDFGALREAIRQREARSAADTPGTEGAILARQDRVAESRAAERAQAQAQANARAEFEADQKVKFDANQAAIDQQRAQGQADFAASGGVRADIAFKPWSSTAADLPAAGVTTATASSNNFRITGIGVGLMLAGGVAAIYGMNRSDADAEDAERDAEIAERDRLIAEEDFLTAIAEAGVVATAAIANTAVTRAAVSDKPNLDCSVKIQTYGTYVSAGTLKFEIYVTPPASAVLPTTRAITSYTVSSTSHPTLFTTRSMVPSGTDSSALFTYSDIPATLSWQRLVYRFAEEAEVRPPDDPLYATKSPMEIAISLVQIANNATITDQEFVERIEERMFRPNTTNLDENGQIKQGYVDKLESTDTFADPVLRRAALLLEVNSLTEVKNNVNFVDVEPVRTPSYEFKVVVNYSDSGVGTTVPSPNPPATCSLIDESSFIGVYVPPVGVFTLIGAETNNIVTTREPGPPKAGAKTFPTPALAATLGAAYGFNETDGIATFVVVGVGTSSGLMYSEDRGITWTYGSFTAVSDTSGFDAVGYNRAINVWIALPPGGGVIFSRNGRTWSPMGFDAFKVNGQNGGVASNADGKFVVVGQRPTIADSAFYFLRSDSSPLWTPGTVGIFSEGRAVANNGKTGVEELWVAVGRGDFDTIATSVDGENWIGQGNTALSTEATGIAYFGGRWVACGAVTGVETNFIYHSDNGVDWVAATTQPAKSPATFGWSNARTVAADSFGNFYATGQGGPIYWSQDGGVTWTTDGAPYDATYAAFEDYRPIF